ncbi:hypothetical protein RUND412_005524 [Rhizina undulata]
MTVSLPPWRRIPLLMIILCLVVFLHSSVVDATTLNPNRKPALYTADYGECMPNSTIQITTFDAAYYADNMTVSFTIEGETQITNDSVVVYLSVNAYGQSRFAITFNPCKSNLLTLCPVRKTVPITASYQIPLSPSDVSGIPDIALVIPDFEGTAELRIFSNSSQTQIACVRALITNGSTFNHAYVISPILAALAAAVCIFSVYLAVNGNGVKGSREFYAHAFSAYILFSCFHTIYFTGTLSVDFPSVVGAFWSNFAFAGGIIPSQTMQNALDKFTRATAPLDLVQLDTTAVTMAAKLYRKIGKRGTTAAVDDEPEFSWGVHEKDGLPVPGNYSGFAGTLAVSDVTMTNAFMTSFLWFLVLVALVTVAIAGTTFVCDGLVNLSLMRNDKWEGLRKNWWLYLKNILQRTALIAAFPMVSLSVYQFSINEPGPKAIAALVFIAFFVGLTSLITYAYYCRWKGGKLEKQEEVKVVTLQRTTKLGFLPWWSFTRSLSPAKPVEIVVSDFERPPADEKEKPAEELGTDKALSTKTTSTMTANISWWKFSMNTGEERGNIHEDKEYTTRFGWLTGRFRRRTWWFFGPWFAYEFIRALFYGGGQGHPKSQIFGLIAVEAIMMILLFATKPFQSVRLNAIMVYFMSIMKLGTLSVLAVIITKPSLSRILVTVLGIIILVIQGIVCTIVLLLTISQLYTSYLLTKPPGSKIRPRPWKKIHSKYLSHVDTRSADLPPAPPPPPPEPVVPHFEISQVRRWPKVADEIEVTGGLGVEVPTLRVPSRASWSGTASTVAEGVKPGRVVSWGGMSTVVGEPRSRVVSWDNRTLTEARSVTGEDWEVRGLRIVEEVEGEKFKDIDLEM